MSPTILLNWPACGLSTADTMSDSSDWFSKGLLHLRSWLPFFEYVISKTKLQECVQILRSNIGEKAPELTPDLYVFLIKRTLNSKKIEL